MAARLAASQAVWASPKKEAEEAYASNPGPEVSEGQAGNAAPLSSSAKKEGASKSLIARFAIHTLTHIKPHPAGSGAAGTGGSRAGEQGIGSSSGSGGVAGRASGEETNSWGRAGTEGERMGGAGADTHTALAAGGARSQAGESQAPVFLELPPAITPEDMAFFAEEAAGASRLAAAPSLGNPTRGVAPGARLPSNSGASGVTATAAGTAWTAGSPGEEGLTGSAAPSDAGAGAGVPPMRASGSGRRPASEAQLLPPVREEQHGG